MFDHLTLELRNTVRTKNLCSDEQLGYCFTNMSSIGRHPALKQKVRSAIKRREALDLVGKGLPITEVAQQLSLTPQSVRRHLRAALATESLFPHTLGAERVAELRTIEGEKLQTAWRHVSDAFEVVDPKNAVAVARLAEATARLNERQSKLWGLEQPTRIVEESLRLSVSKTEQKVTITFDQNALLPSGIPVPGLMISGSVPSTQTIEAEAEVTSSCGD